MHDKLFESLRRVQLGDWVGLASGAGLDVDAITACMQSRDVADRWKADQKAAESYGITGTPALFINGRLLSGAVPLDTLSDVIEEELRRSIAIDRRGAMPVPAKAGSRKPQSTSTLPPYIG